MHTTIYFIQKLYACGVVGLNSIPKCTCAMCMLAYGQTIDACDEYCRIGENTSFECLWHFVKVIGEVFKQILFRKSTQVYLEKQLRVNAKRG
jgi:hypothetical protein